MNDLSPFAAFDAIRTRSAEAVIGQSGLNHPGLAAELRRRFCSSRVEDGALLREPVVEGAPSYKAAGVTMASLAGNLLHPATVAALDGDEEVLTGRERYRFRRNWQPYAHQLAAWRALAEPGPAQSVLVTSGTGSGKTECFLVPIIDDLARQAEAGGVGEGVQAIVLYPLNALIASQEERLRDWTAPFDGRIRFALYNGLLEEHVEANRVRIHPETVPDRARLRASPPPILVTNVTMLEYMLLRPDDAPILATSRGRLRTVVLDEAHSYVGAQAAEIALLLRRVCLAFGTEPQDVRFVATSATIGGPDADKELARFLADVSGAPLDRITVIRGEQHWPALPAVTAGDPFDSVELLRREGENEQVTGQRLYDALAHRREVRPLLEALRQAPVSWSAVERAAAALGIGGADLALALAGARQRTGEGVMEALSPLRIHAFHRAVSGLWTCLDQDCPGEHAPNWPFGSLAGDDAERCAHCGGPTFEVLCCTACGEPYVDVLDREGGRLARPTRARPDDEFAAEAEATEDGDDGSEGETGKAARGGDRNLLTWRALDGERKLHIDVAGARRFDGPGSGRQAFHAVPHGPDEPCACCGTGKRRGGSDIVRPFRFGAPFLLGNVVPILLEGAASPGVEPDPDRQPPLGGRQLLSFTDSRQGTARFAAKLQIGAERNFVRSFVYHTVQAALAEAPDTAEVDAEIALFESMVSGNPGLAVILEGRIKKRDELLAAGGSGLPWTIMRDRLAGRPEVERWLAELWSDRDTRFEHPLALADFLLLREFFRRPRRANSLETMGLARLRFDTVDAASPPSGFTRLGGLREDWRALLDTILTHTVRANSAVRLNSSDKNWIQPKASLTDYVKNAGGPMGKYQRRWPTLFGGGGATSRPIYLLVQGFGLDLADAAARDTIAECLDAAWTALLPLMAQAGSAEHRLDIAQARIAPMSDAFLCPVTRRVLDTAFRGLTPYAAGAGVRAEAITLPRHPAPFPDKAAEGQATAGHAATAGWLAADPAIARLRGAGAWSNLQDRVALFADYFRSAEHSAQQKPETLRAYEGEFKRGTINVLNCSTTMEMGVDIGSVSHVMMTNLPPKLANYRQRVGRAGRRGQAVSLAFTFCKDRPHDRSAFLDPAAFLKRDVRAPRVALDSAVIVQRHVNALLFASFARQHGANALKIKAGAFFGCPAEAKSAEEDENPARHFAHFATLETTRTDLARDIAGLTRGSALAGDLAVFETAAGMMADARARFADEWRALREARAAFASGNAPAAKSLGVQIARLCGEFLLGELSERGFLPSHGFPTGVVSFLCAAPAARAEGKSPRRPSTSRPQRPLDVAMREYAPGSEVVLDGLVYRSAGVTLNWQRPASEAGVSEIQDLQQRWRCRACGDSGSSKVRDGASCPDCGSPDLIWTAYLVPAGFAADLRQEPHADPDEVSFVPAEAPILSLRRAPWTGLADPAQGRRRENRAGSVFFCSSGADRNGYALCLHCGRAEPEAVGTHDAEPWSHKPLMAKAEAGQCPGAVRPFAVKRHMRFGHEITTDVFELQPTGLNSTGAALALAVALREALARRIAVEPGEMGVAAARRADALGTRHSVFLFDRAAGGAGFAIQAGPLLGEIMADAVAVLDCPVEGCVNACPACVLAGDLGEDEAVALRRGPALDIAKVLAATGQPAPEDQAAPGALLVADALDVLAQARDAGRIRLVLRLAAPLDAAALAGWSAAGLARRWSDMGRQVVLSVPVGTVAAMDGAALLSLRDRLSALGSEIEERADVFCENGSRVLAEVVGDGLGFALATRDEDAFDGGPSWGRPRALAVVRFDTARPLLDGSPISRNILRPTPGASVRTIGRELDGTSRSFATTFATLLREMLDAAGAPREPIVEFTYADRYLKSPLTVMLAVRTFAALARTARPGAVRLGLQLRRLEIGGWNGARQIREDWSDNAMREKTVELLATRSGLLCKFLPGDPSHGRRMDITFASGRKASILLDQGFGAWQPRSFTAFPFGASAAEQANALASVDVRITSRGDTYVIAQVT